MFMDARILIIDDDEKYCRLLVQYLTSMGYAAEALHSGDAALERLRLAEASFDAVILDVMMPGMDGFEVLRRIRAFSNVPVLMLTARGEETDRIVGLEIGADDYLPKTFSTRELLARLRAVLRRTTRGTDAHALPSEPEGVLRLGPLLIAEHSRSASLNAQPLDLTPIEFILLQKLAQNAGRVLSRQQLLDAFADRDHDVFDRTIDMHVSSLRKKLGDDPRRPRFIRTVRAAGYLMNDAASLSLEDQREEGL